MYPPDVLNVLSGRKRATVGLATGNPPSLTYRSNDTSAVASATSKLPVEVWFTNAQVPVCRHTGLSLC